MFQVITDKWYIGMICEINTIVIAIYFFNILLLYKIVIANDFLQCKESNLCIDVYHKQSWH